MFYVLQNESTAALRRVPILLTDAATGTSAQTGIALTNIFPYVNINGGAFAGGAGTVAEAGYGQYYYQFDASEVATLGLAGIHITAAGCRNYDAIAQVAAFNMYSGGGVGISAGDVWEYDISAITTAGTAGSQLNTSASGGGAGLSAYDVWSFDYLNAPGGVVVNSSAERLEETRTQAYQAASLAIPSTSDIWNYDISSNTDPTAGFSLYQSAIGATTAAEQVWNYDISAITTAGTAGSQLNLSALPVGAGLTSGDVWSYSDRTITGGSVTSVVDPVEITTTSMSGIANTVWNYDISAISGAGLAGTQLNLAASPSGAGITSGDVSVAVWNSPVASYSTNGTFGKNILRADAANKVGDVTLRSAAGINMVDADVHRIDNDADAAIFLKNALTGIGASWTGNIVGNLTGSVGSVTADVNVSTASMSGIANTVWTVASRTITGGIADTVTSVTNTVDISTQSITDIWSEDVSAYSSPSAGFDLTQAASGGAGITAGDIWEYDISAITTSGTAGSQLNLAALPSGSGITAGDVWDFNITGFGATNSAAVYVTDTNFTVGNIQTYVSTQTPQDVWTYAGIEGRTITGGIADTVTLVSTPVEVSYAAMAGIANTIWSTDISGYTSPSAGFELTQASSGAGLTSGDVSVAVWDADPANYSNNSTFGKGILRSDNAGVAGTVTVWSGASYNGVYADAYRIDASYEAATALKDILTGVGSTITGNITGDVSGSVGSVTADVNVSTASMSGIANTVWSTDISGYTSPSAGFELSNASSGSGISAADVWNYIGTTVTSSTKDTLESALFQAGNAASQTQPSNIRDAVWDEEITYLIGTNTAAGVLYQAAAGTTLNAPVEVWSYATRTLTSSAGATAGDVWSYSDRTITGGSVTSVVDGVTVTTNNDKTGYELSGTQSFNLTGNITGDLSGSVGSVTADVNVDEAAISADVWSYVSRTLTSAAGVTAGDIWEYDVSAITSAGTAGSQLNLAALPSGAGITAGDVWSYIIPGPSTTAEQVLDDIFEATDNINTNTSPSGIKNSVWDIDLSYLSGTAQAGGVLYQAAAGTTLNAPSEVWSYVTRTLTSSAGATAGDVWSYADRTITGGSVTSVVNGVTVSTNNDKTGYSLSGTQSFNLTGNITGSVSGSVGSVTGSVGSVVSPVSVATASMSGIANTVWTAATKTITGGTVDTVTNPVGVSLNSMSGIAGTVWTYSPRTLTSGAGATAGDIWTYNIASITASGTAGATLNDASVSGSVVTIVNGPYRLTSIAEGTDGRIDILAESVQTIQLNCLDGFGQPFNVTGYAAVVNVYDVSGALAVTYTPTVDFASSGIVSFDIDTDVTGTTGRYTLVVELTAGAEVVQLGPLEILVRPL